MNPAIIVIAYNRTTALKRLLGMLAVADYDAETTLLISIDKSDNLDVRSVADDFDWQHGDKKVIAHEKNLGLEKHILFCGDLTREYGSLIMLEDDLLISESYYLYAQKALYYYAKESDVAGISLYSYRRTENTLSKFNALDTGFDTFFMKLPSSWGQAWTEEQWNGFRIWLKDWDGTFHHIPVYIQFWLSNSWKKIFTEYLVSQGKYFAYPKDSYTSNPGEVGTNYKSQVAYFNTPLSKIKAEIRFAPWTANSLKYDTSFEIDPNIIKANNDLLKDYDFSMDLNGGKTPEEIKTPFVLTTQRCRRPIQMYSKNSFPLEDNILNNIRGKGIYLCRKEDMRFGILFRMLNKFRPYYYNKSKMLNKLKFRFWGNN